MNVGNGRAGLRTSLRDRLLGGSREQALDEKGDLPPSSRFGHIDDFPLLRPRALAGNFHHEAVHEAVDDGVRLGIHGLLKTRGGGHHLHE
jgi:hypothetical protein